LIGTGFGRLSKCVSDLDDKLVIVEGTKDSKALKSLGVKNIMHLGGKPIADFTFHVSKSHCSNGNGEEKEVVILTDFDSEGERIAARLECLFRKHKVHVNSRLRRRFMKFGKLRIEDIKEGDVYGETRPHINKVRGKGHNKGKRNSRKA
jgi:5S rRNA maturation endonuclease (ribonuclease M5)